MSKQVVLRCPTCKTLVTEGDEHFPFCSDRCRLIDLGKWASSGYRISSPVLDPGVLEGLNPPGQNQVSGRKDDDDGS